MKKSVEASPLAVPSGTGERDSCALPIYRSVRLRHPPYEACSNGILFLYMPVKPMSIVQTRKRIEHAIQNTIDLRPSSLYSHKGVRP